MLEKIEGRRRGWQRMRWLDGISYSMTWVWASSGSCDGQGSRTCCNPWGCKELDMTERLTDWLKHRKNEDGKPSKCLLFIHWCHSSNIQRIPIPFCIVSILEQVLRVSAPDRRRGLKVKERHCNTKESVCSYKRVSMRKCLDLSNACVCSIWAIIDTKRPQMLFFSSLFF